MLHNIDKTESSVKYLIGEVKHHQSRSPQICHGKENAEVTIWKYILHQHFLGNIFAKAVRILY